MILVRNGQEGIFSEADWKSGQPQRYGWQKPGQEKKELPKEIIQFIQRRRPPEPLPSQIETVQDQMDELSKEVVEKVTKPKKVKKAKKAKKEKIVSSP
jgi:uncharacterized coiled-coil DUF342 family protein